MNNIKLDLGSGPEDFWYWQYGTDVIRIDVEKYPKVVQANCSSLPIKDNTIKECFIGRLLVETSIDTHIQMAHELNRVMRSDGQIKMHVYFGTLGFVDFFRTMEQLGWYRVTEELNNFIDWPDEFVIDYIIKLEKIRP